MLLDLSNKKGIVLGIANKWSIAYHVAKMLHNCGAEIIISYGVPQLEGRVQDISKELDGIEVMFYDASDENSVNTLVDQVKDKWDDIDFIVHAIAFSDKKELRGDFFKTSRANFTNSMAISCYSLVELSNAFLPLMKHKNSSILTFSYYGAEKIIPNYNIMGTCKAALENTVKYLAYSLGKYSVRVNAISAGPLKTLSSAGISDFSNVYNWVQDNGPMKRSVMPEEVAKAAVFMVSDMASGITGEILHVDCGYNIMGMKYSKEDLSLEDLLAETECK